MMLKMQENGTYITRKVAPLCARYLATFPVVGITGPRQAGKSTLLQHTLTDYTYVTFDDPKNIEFFAFDPQGFINKYSNKVIFDEIQYVPELFQYIKMAVDNDRANYGKFVVTGSCQFALNQNISESLAGRIGILTLLPLQYAEIPADSVDTAIYQGCYPELINRHYFESQLWYAAYFDTYLSKDVRSLSNIGNLRDFQRFISLLAANVAQILDMSHYARDLGVSVSTIKRWISILEASYILFLLPPYFNNFGKRIVKSPKLYFYDNGLVCYLTGMSTQEQYEKSAHAGALYENYIIAEIYKKQLHEGLNQQLFYLRTQDGVEIDLIIDKKSSQEYIEIKKTATFSVKLLRHLHQFTKENHQNAVLIYNGKTFAYDEKIQIMQYRDYLT
jgi:uncharacterized protein